MPLYSVDASRRLHWATSQIDGATPMTIDMYTEEKPLYHVMWDQIRAGEVVPFLGAGASVCNRPMDEDGRPVRWTGSHAPFLPNVHELSDWLALRCEFPETTASADLAKIASYHEIRTRRKWLVRSLREVFSKEYEFAPIHAFLADCPTPLLIVTTNYDNLIEKAFQAKGRPYHLVTHPKREEYAASVLWWKPGATAPEIWKPSTLPLSLTDTSIIYKMHGTAHSGSTWSSFVITEEDYVRVLARMSDKLAIPARFMTHFMKSSFLFLGYGLRDWNVRVLLETLHSTVRYNRHDKQMDALLDGDTIDDMLSSYTSEQDDLVSWAIQHRPSQVERKLWEHRDVKIYDLSLDDFVVNMQRERSREVGQ